MSCDENDDGNGDESGAGGLGGGGGYRGGGDGEVTLAVLR